MICFTCCAYCVDIIHQQDGGEGTIEKHGEEEVGEEETGVEEDGDEDDKEEDDEEENSEEVGDEHNGEENEKFLFFIKFNLF